jgi:uncharacterized membrane protein
MKPSLVEYDKIFKKKTIPVEIIKKPGSKVCQIDNYHFFFNIFGIVIVVIGVVILYKRRNDKERNKRLHTQRIIQFYHDTNKFE